MIWSKLKIDNYFTTSADKKIQKYILEHPEKVPYMSIKELGKKSKTSDSAVTRFCKKIGLKGYKDLKIELSKSMSTFQKQYIQVNSDIFRQDTVSDIFDKVTKANYEALHQSKQTINLKALEEAVHCIETSNIVQLVGVGNSASIALDILYKLRRIQINTHFSFDHHMQLAESSFLTPKDTVLAVTVSGKTREVVELLQIAKEKGAKTICIAQMGHLISDKFTDIKLEIPFTESELREGSMSARINQLNIVDVLFVSLLAKRFDYVQGGIIETRRITQYAKIKK